MYIWKKIFKLIKPLLQEDESVPSPAISESDNDLVDAVVTAEKSCLSEKEDTCRKETTQGTLLRTYLTDTAFLLSIVAQIKSIDHAM